MSNTLFAYNHLIYVLVYELFVIIVFIVPPLHSLTFTLSLVETLNLYYLELAPRVPQPTYVFLYIPAYSVITTCHKVDMELSTHVIKAGLYPIWEWSIQGVRRASTTSSGYSASASITRVYAPTWIVTYIES